MGPYLRTLIINLSYTPEYMLPRKIRDELMPDNASNFERLSALLDHLPVLKTLKVYIRRTITPTSLYLVRQLGRRLTQLGLTGLHVAAFDCENSREHVIATLLTSISTLTSFTYEDEVPDLSSDDEDFLIIEPGNTLLDTIVSQSSLTALDLNTFLVSDEAVQRINVTPSIIACASGLTRLSLADLQLSMQALSWLLQWFPHLKQLDLYSVDFEADDDLTFDSKPSFEHLESLTLHDIHNFDSPELLLTLLQHAQPVYLALGVRSLDESSLLINARRRLGIWHRVEELEILQSMPNLGLTTSCAVSWICKFVLATDVPSFVDRHGENVQGPRHQIH